MTSVPLTAHTYTAYHGMTRRAAWNRMESALSRGGCRSAHAWGPGRAPKADAGAGSEVKQRRSRGGARGGAAGPRLVAAAHGLGVGLLLRVERAAGGRGEGLHDSRATWHSSDAQAARTPGCGAHSGRSTDMHAVPLPRPRFQQVTQVLRRMRIRTQGFCYTGGGHAPCAPQCLCTWL